MCGFIAELVEQHIGIAKVMGSNRVEALNVTGSFCFFNCLNWGAYGKDCVIICFFSAMQNIFI